MITVKHFSKLNHIVIALTHLPPVNGNHIIMDPIAGWRHMIANSALCNFTFMMRKQKVHTTAMNIELLTEVLCTHSRAFDMPSRKAIPPGAFPSHDMLGRGSLP